MTDTESRFVWVTYMKLLFELYAIPRYPPGIILVIFLTTILDEFITGMRLTSLFAIYMSLLVGL